MVGQAFPYPRRSIHTSTGDIQNQLSSSEHGKILDGVVLFPPWTGRDVRRGSSTFHFVMSGSLFAVAGATGGSGSRLRSIPNI